MSDRSLADGTAPVNGAIRISRCSAYSACAMETIPWLLCSTFARRIFDIFVHDVRKRFTENVEGIPGSGLSSGRLGRARAILRHDGNGFKGCTYETCRVQYGEKEGEGEREAGGPKLRFGIYFFGLVCSPRRVAFSYVILNIKQSLESVSNSTTTRIVQHPPALCTRRHTWYPR